MRVAVTGASGFVGSHLVEHLALRGHAVQGLSRRPEGARAITANGGEGVVGDVTKPATLPPLLQGADAVVHLVAIIRERPGETFDAVIRGGAEDVLDAAKAAGVRRFVHQSALGAADDPRYPYLQAKARAERAVQASGLDWTILRPSLLFGEGDKVFTLLADMAAKQPVMPVIGRGDMRLQPLWVQDEVRIIERCLEEPRTVGQVYELGGPEHVRYEDMVKAAMDASGHRKPLVHVPTGVMGLVARAMELTMRAPPLTVGELDMLLRGDNVTDLDSVQRHFGFHPTPLRDGLAYLAQPRGRDARPGPPRGAGAPGTRGPA